MRSLFVKIFGVCVFVLVLTIATNTFIRLTTFRVDSPRRDSFSNLLTFELNEARHAFETGGKPALQSTLERLSANTQTADMALTDANGIDLLTGQDRSELVKRAQNRGWFAYSGGDSRSFARVSTDQQYWFFVHAPFASLFAAEDRKRLLVEILLAIIPTWLLVRFLTRPLVRLEQAMQRFGSGDLNARAAESSSDEFGRLGRSFNWMAEHIRTLLGAERRLLQDISHELRSPLTRMQVAIELARHQNVPSSHLDRIQQEADRLNDLVGQLLYVNRAEAETNRSSLQPVRLDEVTAQVVETCTIEAHAKNCFLELEQVGNVTVRGDAELLRRAIENVVRNAIRYAPELTAICVRLEVTADDVKVAVRDFGPGVPADCLTRIFDAFYRLESDRDRASGGIGLGLSITRRAIELHKGHVAAFNADPGLLVEIHLPA